MRYLKGAKNIVSFYTKVSFLYLVHSNSVQVINFKDG